MARLTSLTVKRANSFIYTFTFTHSRKECKDKQVDMSGTAPSDPAPGGHPSDRGIDQTSLDANQHGAAQNSIEETKETSGSVTDRNIGQTIDEGRAPSKPSARVDELLNEPASRGANAGTERKAEAREEQGFKGEDGASLHDLAAGKQP